MQGISVLVFSRDDIERLSGLIDQVYGIADEIVLIDSSCAANREKLHRMKSRKKLAKLRIHYTVPLGFADPMRMYGIGLCRREWILYLDTDERMSPEFVKDIPGIIKGARCSAFAIKRDEKATASGHSGSFTWQIRLFRRGRATYKGILHEQPLIRGKVYRLEDRYMILHMARIKGNAGLEYGKLERFDRMSYKMYRERILEYIYRLDIRESKVSVPLYAKAVDTLLHVYTRLATGDPEEEICALDYFAFFCIRDIAFHIKLRLIRGMWRIPLIEAKRALSIARSKATYEGKRDFWLSKEIYTRGIIDMLGLSNPKTIEELNRRYKDKEGGISLLLKMLYEYYDARHLKAKRIA